MKGPRKGQIVELYAVNRPPQDFSRRVYAPRKVHKGILSDQAERDERSDWLMRRGRVSNTPTMRLLVANVQRQIQRVANAGLDRLRHLLVSQVTR